MSRRKFYHEHFQVITYIHVLQSCDIIEFLKWPTLFQRLCSKQRKIIDFLTEINNRTYLKLLVFSDIASSS
jgi:hypothetical protein